MGNKDWFPIIFVFFRYAPPYVRNNAEFCSTALGASPARCPTGQRQSATPSRAYRPNPWVCVRFLGSTNPPLKFRQRSNLHCILNHCMELEQTKNAYNEQVFNQSDYFGAKWGSDFARPAPLAGAAVLAAPAANAWPAPFARVAENPNTKNATIQL